MKIIPFIMILFLSISYTLFAEPPNIPGIITIKAGIVESPPAWAVSERNLIKKIEEIAPYYINRFTKQDGSLYGGGPYDDVYEMFYNWPLFYAMGGDDKILDWAQKEYNAITLQSTVPGSGDYNHQLYKEFPRHDDWFHISEGMMAFYDFGVADPANDKNIERAKKFAGFYMNEDIQSSANFDPLHKIIPSNDSGSMGPSSYIDGTYMINYGHADLYPIVQNLESNWESTPTRKKKYSIYMIELWRIAMFRLI